VTLVGDFAQLPPVPNKDASGKPIPTLFAFESPEWPKFAAHVTKLEKIWRQTDLDFVRGLHAVRKADLRAAMAYFTPEKFLPTTDDAFDGTTIFAKNDSVDRHNQLRLDQIKATPYHYESQRWGKQRPDWKNVPDRLELRDGALVMILANRRDIDSKKMIYANGDLGVLRGRDSNGACLVELKRTGRVEKVLLVRRENTIPLSPGRRKELREQGLSQLITEDGKNEIIGTITYLPLRVAYAATVHKTQGLTLDSVQVNIRDGFFKTPGMLFVALSRARTPGGLRIVGDPRGFMERCKVDARVVPWL
jgi:ATP-dependent DNA helicase PIF1